MLLDGLDETPSYMRSELDEEIQTFASTCDASQLIVSSRSIDSFRDPRFTKWILQSPTDEDAKSYIFQGNLGDLRKRGAVAILKILGSLANDPIMLNMIAMAIRDDDFIQMATDTQVSNLIDEWVTRKVSAADREHGSDLARLLLRGMVGEDGKRLILSELTFLANGRRAGLTDVQTLAYVETLMSSGLIDRINLNYSLTHDVVATHFARER